MPTSKDHLKGQQLDNGWDIYEKLDHSTGTGGNFSAGYLVRSPEGTRYFMKAIDFDRALREADPARALGELVEAFNFERDLVAVCKRYSCIVTTVQDGKITSPRTGQIVQYLLFELADTDVRKMVSAPARMEASLALRILHRVALGLRQLHTTNTGAIAHQDVKPSNVLGFRGNAFKIADLGRASVKGKVARHDHFLVAGDPQYAPIEQAFGYASPEFNVRRLACDAYMLGGLAVYLFANMSITAMIVNRLPVTSRPGYPWNGSWAGTFELAIPQIQIAFSDAIAEVDRAIDDSAPFKQELMSCIRQLCEPDPSKRGHPVTRAQNAGTGNAYDLDRYVAIFDRLSKKAEVFEHRLKRDGTRPGR